MRWFASSVWQFARKWDARWLFFLLTLLVAVAAHAEELAVRATPFVWQQAAREPQFYFFMERERYTNLDRAVRFVCAADDARAGAQRPDVTVRWSIKSGGTALASGTATLTQGGADFTFPLAGLAGGRYDVAVQFVQDQKVVAEKAGFLRYEEVAAPAQQGRVAVWLPRGAPLAGSPWPVQAGVPFPKGVLWDAAHLRVCNAAGAEVDADAVVRGRWGPGSDASIRWIGLTFQAAGDVTAPSPGRGPYYIEFGPEVARAAPRTPLAITDTPAGITIDTGAAQLFIRRQGFNVIDQWNVPARHLRLQGTPQHGLYVVDHEGATYRAANDTQLELSVEEQSALHVVVRAAGWYVKDGAPAAPTQELTLPTDKLCRFVTRIEAYAGQPYVRVVNTLIVTYDTFKVRLRDAGMTLPTPGAPAAHALFGIEDAAPQEAPVGAAGVRGVQHLHDAFTVEDGAARTLAEAKRSAGWGVAVGAGGALAVTLRDFWQRYPKELEVLPDRVTLHVWPAHGRMHPQIQDTADNQIHKLLFAHQGQEMNLAMPWSYYFAACDIYGGEDAGGVNHTLAAVQASALGVATTSDTLWEIGGADDVSTLADHAASFQRQPLALADPQWNCASLALGYMHPYDPENFPTLEDVIQNCMRGYWQYQDMGEMFGMWIYRSWLHSQYRGNGAWELYRLYNGSHHHEAVIPWLLYARSGDPFYFQQGMANIRQFTDVQMIHHADARYTHLEDSNQSQLVGSTKHDNCVVPWGRDHAVLGHVTCYNGAIAAYYLTGDLRLREVLEDEWLHTLLGDRGNPELAKADLSNTVFTSNPRNNSTAVGELLDAYQLTYDPRLLVCLAPRFDIWTTAPGNMGSDWGQPLHHEILFRGSTAVQEKLFAGVEALRRDQAALDQPIVRPLHAAHEMFALAGILRPQDTYAREAFSHVSQEYLQTYAWHRRTGKLHDVFCNTGDFVLYLPRMMYALAHGDDAQIVPVLGAAQAALRHPTEPTRVVVREDVDQDFHIYVQGEVKQPGGFAVQVFAPNGALVLRERVPTGRQALTFTVPRDGQTGQYVIFMGALQNDRIFAPYTKLPEVYCANYWTGNNDAQQYFTRSPTDAPVQLLVQPGRAPGAILAADQLYELAATETGELMRATVGPQGAWVWNRACYIGTARAEDEKQPVIFSSTPARWFMPDAAALTIAPAP